MLLPTSSPRSYILIAQLLEKRGFHITLFILGSDAVNKRYETNNIQIKPLVNRGIFYSPFVSIINPLLLFIFIKSSLKDNSDVYWGQGYAILPVLLFLKLFGKKVIYDVGDDSPSNFAHVIKNRLHLSVVAPFAEVVFRAFENFVISKVDYVITLTKSLKDKREKHARNIKSIYQCVHSSFTPNNVDTELKKEYSGFNVIVYSGTVAIQKGIREIISAFDMVKKIYPKSILLLVGGMFSNDEKAITKLLKNRHDINMTGWLPHTDMPQYINLGKVGLAIVNPISYSYRISIPFKLFEQMACGLPVIAPKGFPEIENVVKRARCGILVDVSRPEEIAGAIVDILENESMRLKMSRNSMAYIRKYHSIEQFDRETFQVFNTVIGQNSKTD